MENQDIAANYREENSILVSRGISAVSNAGFILIINNVRLIYKVVEEFLKLCCQYCHALQ